MKVKFRHSETNKEHTVKCQAQDFYILESTPMNWSSDCFVAVRKSAVDEVKVEHTYNIGQRFYVGYNKDEAVLCQVSENMVSLISLISGDRYLNPISVRRVSAITQAELNLMCTQHTMLIS